MTELFLIRNCHEKRVKEIFPQDKKNVSKVNVQLSQNLI